MRAVRLCAVVFELPILACSRSRFRACLGTVAESFPELLRRGHDRGTPRRGTRRTACDRRIGQRAVADLDAHVVDAAPECIRGDEGQCSPCTCAEVCGTDLHGETAGSVVPDRRLRTGIDHVRICGDRDAGPDQPPTVTPEPGVRSCASQPNRRAPSRRHSTSLRDDHGFPVSGSTSGSLRSRNSIGSIPQASASSSIATSPAYIPGASPRAHPERRRYVQRHRAVRRPQVRYPIQVSGRHRGLLDELRDVRRLRVCLVDQSPDGPVAVGGDAYMRCGRRAIAT